MRHIILAAAILGGVLVSPAAADTVAIGYQMPGSITPTEGREQQAARAAEQRAVQDAGSVTLGNGGLVCELVTPNMARCRIGGER